MIRNAITILILIFSFNIAFSQIKGKAIKVYDGDSFTFVSEENDTIKIRLFGIDCPEKKQPYGEYAQRFSYEFLNNKKITIFPQGKPDRYKRILAIVYVDANKQSLNELLLKNGYAWHYKQYNNWVSYSYLEENARKMKKGLWKDKDPIAPWDFRKTKKKK